MSAPILSLDGFLVVTIQKNPTDSEIISLHETLLRRVSEVRTDGVLIDLTALEVMDSFCTRMLRAVARTIGLRGAPVVIAGIQPEVAFAMVQLGLTLQGIPTALDLEEGIDLLRRRRRRERGS